MVQEIAPHIRRTLKAARLWSSLSLCLLGVAGGLITAGQSGDRVERGGVSGGEGDKGGPVEEPASIGYETGAFGRTVPLGNPAEDEEAAVGIGSDGSAGSWFSGNSTGNGAGNIRK